MECLQTFLDSFNHSLNQSKTIKEIKRTSHVILVIFDFCIMMLTLSLSSIYFPNQIFWSFCIVSKITWKWSCWYLQTLLNIFQMLILSMQSPNVLTEFKTSKNTKFTKSNSSAPTNATKWHSKSTSNHWTKEENKKKKNKNSHKCIWSILTKLIWYPLWAIQSSVFQTKPLENFT